VKHFFAFLAWGLMASTAAQAQQKQPCAMAGENNAFLGIQTVRLWPGDAPEAKGKACEDTPTLTIFEPQRGHGNGSAVVILPGGGYLGLAANLEGRQVADWFTARGFRAFVVSYRLSSNGYLLPVPLLDARRAVQTTSSLPIALRSLASLPAATWPRSRPPSLWRASRTRTIPSSGCRAVPTI
jgi:acetyl esterase/lipase